MNNKTAIHYQVDIFKSISRKHEEQFHSGIYVDSRKSFSDRLDAKLHVDSHALLLCTVGWQEDRIATVVFALVALAMSVIEYLHSNMLKGSIEQVVNTIPFVLNTYGYDEVRSTHNATS